MKNPFKRSRKNPPQVLAVTYDGRTVEFPLCWEKTTLKQFNAFYESETIRGTVEAFASDIDVLHTLMGAEEIEILGRMTFRHEIPNFLELPVPTHLDGIEFKGDVGECTLLQKWALDSWLDERDETDINFVNASVQLLSVYLYPVISGEILTDLTQAQRPEIRSRVESLPCLYALPLAAFFLTRYRNPITSGATTYRIDSRPIPPLRPRRPWYLRWMSIPSFRRSTPLQSNAI